MCLLYFFFVLIFVHLLMFALFQQKFSSFLWQYHHSDSILFGDGQKIFLLQLEDALQSQTGESVFTWCHISLTCGLHGGYITHQSMLSVNRSEGFPIAPRITSHLNAGCVSDSAQRHFSFIAWSILIQEAIDSKINSD